MTIVEVLKTYSPFRRARLRVLLSFVGVVLFATGLARVEALRWSLSGAAILAGMAVHLAAKGHLNLNNVLTTTGPYRWVRHPFYSAILLIDLGLCGMIGRWDVALLYVAFWCFAYAGTIRREEEELAGIHGGAFLEYAARVPALLPWKGPVRTSGTGGGFSWSNPNLSRGKEVPRLILIPVRPALFALAAIYHAKGLHVPTIAEGALLTAPLLLWIASLAVERHLVRNGPMTSSQATAGSGAP